MNTTKRLNFGIVLLLTSMILLSSNLFAQQEQRKRQGSPIPNETQINKMVNDLSVELSLSEAKKSEILALYIDHFSEAKTSMENNSGQRKSREEMEIIKTKFEDDVKSLLNSEQQGLYGEFLNNNRPQNGQDKQRHQQR